MTSPLASRLVALCALVAGGRALAAQSSAPVRSTYYMVLGADTIGVERFTRTPQRLEGEFLDKARGMRVRYAASLANDGGITSAETWLYRGTDDTTALQHARLRLQADSVIVEFPNGAPTQRIATQRGALVYISPSFALLEQALFRAKVIGGTTAQVPLFSSAGGQTLPLSVTWAGADSAVLSMGPIEMRASIGLDGRLTGLAVPSQNLRVVRVEGTRAAALPKPDYSPPANAPYTAEEVTVRTPAGVTLRGTLTLPRTRPSKGVPGVVTITGSGAQERDESIPGVKGYRPFREIADTLARRGIAVLRLDDRGAGASDAGPAGATSADFANDVRAALAYLRTRSEIDGDHLALVGHSEGGMIAPMVAATEPRVRAIVLLAGPSWSGRKILSYQQRYAADSMLRVTGRAKDSALAAMSKSLDSVAASQGWLRYFLDYDPIATAKQVRQPVLVLQGATDRQVTADQANELAAAFRAGGNRDVTETVFPNTNHLFLADPDGNPGGYAKLSATSVRPEVLGAIADWLAARLGRAASGV